MSQPEEMNVYLISGLGADWKLFRKLDLPKNFTEIHLEWIKPKKNESIENYARRFSEKVDISKPFCLIGLSFGGMVAVEMNKFIKPAQTILISSACDCGQIPWYYKLGGTLHLPKIVPSGLIKFVNPLTYWFFGAKGKEARKVLRQTFREMDSWFMKWAMQRTATWNNTFRPENIFHIHGTADKVLPIKYCKPDISIKGGEHLMVFTLSDKISSIVTDKLMQWK